MPEPILVIICGKQPTIALGVKNALQPEYEVIRVILTPEAGVAEIPSLLQGEALPKSDNLGTQNYTNPVAAIITGGGYDDENFAKMKKACEGKGSVPWLRPNRSTPTPSLGPAYGKAIVERVKACFNKLVEDGKLKGDGVYFY